jgi:ABC-type polysaccharide/polyol phosphate export permease
MTVGRPQAVLMLVVGVVLLAAGITILATVPGWGAWIAAYPSRLSEHPVSGQAAALAAGFGGAIGPLLAHVGHYIRDAGYFVGSLVTFMSLLPLGAGIGTLLRRAA